MPTYVPITAAGLTGLLTDRILAARNRIVVAVIGADAADPVPFAHIVSRALRDRGRPAAVVSVHDYVRPASIRLEFGRNDEMSYRTLWFDYEALAREVVDSLRTQGRWLPALWDEKADRSARATVETATDNTVVIVAGPMLLGRGLAFDLTVRLQLGEGALRRATAPDHLWTVDALLAHDRLVAEIPDIDVRWDHRDRPAVAERGDYQPR